MKLILSLSFVILLVIPCFTLRTEKRYKTYLWNILIKKKKTLKLLTILYFFYRSNLIYFRPQNGLLQQADYNMFAWRLFCLLACLLMSTCSSRTIDVVSKPDEISLDRTIALEPDVDGIKLEFQHQVENITSQYTI